MATQAALTRQVRYDRAADEHYDTISAFIKSVRGSDPDAALFWLAKMLEGGEAPEFMARRIVILASEDIGNADPQALPLAIAAASAVERLGLPEARYALAQATIYLAAAPKSNAAGRALGAAEQAIRRGANLEVPLHLRGAAHPGLAEAHGQSVGYEYPHDHPGNWVAQKYMPGRQRFYDGRGGGEERELWRRLERRRTRHLHPPAGRLAGRGGALQSRQRRLARAPQLLGRARPGPRCPVHGAGGVVRVSTGRARPSPQPSPSGRGSRRRTGEGRASPEFVGLGEAAGAGEIGALARSKSFF